MSNKHILWDADEVTERMSADFDRELDDLQKTEWRLRDALDDLDKLTA